MDFWRNDLQGAKYVLAPMVGCSELPWRLLARMYGAHLCYTPMIHASIFAKNMSYRRESMMTCPEDKPLIIQFCANDTDIFRQAVTLCNNKFTAVDLNLGCPQVIARRGNYGAFLMEDWQLLNDMVRSASNAAKIPITCKIRVFPDVRKTVDYARMLENAGASLLTVHGRTRDQRGPLTGVANWEYITAVRNAVKIPIFANGNIQSLADVEKCLQETEVQGVMSAEGHLHNPAIFQGRNPPTWEVAQDYLNLAQKYPCPISSIRTHLFKLFQHLLTRSENSEIREMIASTSELSVFLECVEKLKEKYAVHHTDQADWNEPLGKFGLPPWICQPYERVPPDEYLIKQQVITSTLKGREDVIRKCCEHCPPGTSKQRCKKMKKMLKRGLKKNKRTVLLCANCPNPKGDKCVLKMCKQCCRKECYKGNIGCTGHRILACPAK